MKFFKNLFQRKASVTIVSTQANTTAIWSDKNYEVFAKETYLKNVISFRCVDLISKSVSTIKWKVMETKSDGFKEEISSHPLLDLMSRPNPQQGWSAFIKALISYLVMSGNSYIRRTAPLSGPNKGIPKELDLLRPDRMKILLSSSGELAGYEYTKPSIYTGSIAYTQQYLINPIIGQSDVLHLKLFNPVDDNYGASITEPIAREVDTSNTATEWNKKLLDNEARPGMILTYKKNLTEEQFQRIKTQMDEKHSGSKNAGRNLILEDADGTTVTTHGFTPAEMDFIEGNREMARRISLGYGVPPQLLGIPGDSTYSNFEQAREAFWDETVIFYAGFIQTEFNNWFFPKQSKIGLEYSLEGIPAYYSRQSKLWERAKSADFLSINEKREMVGLEKTPGGDVVLIPMSSIPLEMAGESENELIQNEETAKESITKRGYNKEQINDLFGENW